MIPERFRGVWQRVSLSVDGAPWSEPAQVVWVQAGSIFCDLRLPFDGCEAEHPTMSFAGTLSWSEPRLTWSHKLDLYGTGDGDGDGQVDTAEVSWHGADLVCAGQFPRETRTVPYAEVWHRLAGPAGRTLSLIRADGHGVLVQVGDHAVTIVDDRARGGEYRACYRTRGADGWAVALGIGEAAERVPGPPRGAELSDAMVLDGRRWHVLEHAESAEERPAALVPTG